MGLRIQNNVEAFNAHRNLTTVSTKASKAMEKLSSGYRINRAADDAAGLAISEKMRAQIGGIDQSQRNAQDGISLVQTAEGSLAEVTSMLQRVRDLKVQFSNGTLSSDDKDAIAKEMGQLATEITSISIADQVQRHGAARRHQRDVPGRRGDGRDDPDDGLQPVGHRRRFGRRGPQRRARRPPASARSPWTSSTRPSRACRPPVRASARSRTASSTASTTSRPTRRTWWRPRVADPRRGHGLRDGQLHQAPDPAAGRHEHARAGQPGPAGRPDAPARLVPKHPARSLRRAAIWPPVHVNRRFAQVFARAADHSN